MPVFLLHCSALKGTKVLVQPRLSWLLQIAFDESSRKDDVLVLRIVGKVACDKNRIAESGYLVELSVGLIPLEWDVFYRVWDNGDTILDDGFKDSVYFALRELKLGVVENALVLLNDPVVVADCESSHEDCLEYLGGVASRRPCGGYEDIGIEDNVH